MKTAEEIKRGLRVCDSVGRVIKAESWCKEKCPYMDEKFGCGQDYLLADALAYIQQLEAERDAALADFKLYRERNIKGESGVYACDLCKRGGRYEDWDEIKCPTGCTGVSHWQWRGAQKEE